MNGEQTGFVRFINQLQMASFGSFVSQVAWIVGSFAFTYVACAMFLSEGMNAEQHHSYGLQLAIALLAAWTGKSGINAAANFGVRKTAKEYVEAQAKGKAAAGPVVHADKVEHVELNAEPKPGIPLESALVTDHQWASGDPRAGIL